MRTIFAAAFALLAAVTAPAAAPSFAQKPGADEALDPAREEYRGQGISICVAEMRPTAGITPDALEAMCGCAFERFLDGRPTAALPALAPGRLRAVMGGPLLACAAGQDARLAAAVARRLAEPSAVPGPPPLFTAETPAVDKPEPSSPDPDPDSDSGPGFDLRAWLDGLSLPSWLRGLPLWAWIPIAFLVLGLLGALFRRRDDRQDLMGPPRHMRPGARLPNLPPRG